MRFTTCKDEQPLKSMVLQETQEEKDKYIRKLY